MRATGTGAPVGASSPPARRAEPVGARRTAAGATGGHAHFRVLGQRELALRARRRRTARLLTLSVGLVVAAMLAVAAAQALVAERQVRLDAIEQQLGAAVAQEQGLQATRASLEAPTRVLRIAERAGMTMPRRITNLEPVDPGPSVRARAGDVPVPPALALHVPAAERLIPKGSAGRRPSGRRKGG